MGNSSLRDICNMVIHFDSKYSCLIEKNAPIAFILPSRWQDGTESLGMETTSCLCYCPSYTVSTFFAFIYTTAYHLGQFEKTIISSTKEVHAITTRVDYDGKC